MTREDVIDVLTLRKELHEETAEALDMAIEALSADTVEVVRCRNCIHSKDTGDYQDTYFCTSRTHAQDFLVHSLDYCSYGERSEE